MVVLGGSVAGLWLRGLPAGMVAGPSSWTATGSPAYAGARRGVPHGGRAHVPVARVRPMVKSLLPGP
ncbi:hypothetical protein AMK21_31315 [Streptomyces sp. CB00316]|nr:hypothetical protein AMK21_31315 [Streptomyces sp. CB00316]